MAMSKSQNCFSTLDKTSENIHIQHVQYCKDTMSEADSNSQTKLVCSLTLCPVTN